MDFLKSMAGKLISTLLGLGLVLAWWTIRGPSDVPGRTQDNQIPAQIWEGGENQLQVKVTSNTQGRAYLSFEAPDPNKPDETRWFEATEIKEPGSYDWTIAFPKDTFSGLVEFGAVEPKVGDKLEWEVFFNGKSIQKDTKLLEKPLEPGWGMALQVELEEFLNPDSGSEDSMSDSDSE